LEQLYVLLPEDDKAYFYPDLLDFQLAITGLIHFAGYNYISSKIKSGKDD